MRIANHAKHPRLTLYAPGTFWTVSHLGPNTTETTVDADTTIQVRAMVPPTLEHLTWVEGTMREHAPPDAVLERIALESIVSTRGWPVAFAHYLVRDASGRPWEERAGAFYRIVHNRAEVVVRLKNGVRWADRAATLRPLILSAHVDWPVYEHDLLYTLLGFNL